jgi:hypothetical protein
VELLAPVLRLEALDAAATMRPERISAKCSISTAPLWRLS